MYVFESFKCVEDAAMNLKQNTNGNIELLLGGLHRRPMQYVCNSLHVKMSRIPCSRLARSVGGLHVIWLSWERQRQANAQCAPRARWLLSH
eukprot:4835-Pleurochrysis_carterae.AAC.4